MRRFIYLALFASQAALATLPLSITSAPTISAFAINQTQQLSYTIKNNLKKQLLPIQQITVLNDGDEQTQLTTNIDQNCNGSLAPQASCTINITLNGIQAGIVKRHLAIQYDGRAPLTSPIVANAAQAKYTVLVYIVGSNLESVDGSATTNIEQMMEVGSNQNINIVIETGGAFKDGWRTVKRHLILPNEDLILDDLGAINMGLVSTITDFFTWGVTHYPADKYIAIFWNHGGGPNGGFGSDDLFSGTKTSISELSTALKSITETAGKSFEIVGFDTCLLGNIETFSGLYPYSNYLVGSEDLEPGLGWQYDDFLRLIDNNPTVDGLAIGKNIVDGFNIQNTGHSTTLALVSAKEVPNVIEAINQFSTSLLPYASSTAANWKMLAKARVRTPDYGTSSWDNQGYDVADLVGFAQAAIYNFPADADVQASANALISATQSAVKYRRNSPNRSASYGMTIYFPSILQNYVSSYQSATLINGSTYFSQNYLDLVNNYNNYYLAQSASLIASPTAFAFDGTNYTTTVTNDFEEMYAAGGNDACTNVFYSNGTPVGVVPCYSSIQANGMTAVAGGGNTWQISYNKADNLTEWPLINGKPMLFIVLDTEPVTANEISFIIPVMLDQQSGYLDVVRDADMTYRVVGFQQDTGSTNPEGKTMTIADGTQFYLRTYAQMGSNWRLMRTDEVITAPFTITTGPASTDMTNFRFIVSDLTGTLRVTPSSLAY